MAKKHSFRKEILRKLFHLLELPVLMVYTLLRYYWSERVAVLTLTALFLFLLECEYFRLEVKPKIPQHLDILRDRERNNIAGSIFFIISTIIAFSVFDYQIALLALLMTVFGDLVSALVGIKFGKHKIFRKKTLEGFTAGFLMNMLVGWLFIPEQIVVFVLMAFVASLVELFTGKLDDNLTVPLFAGFVGQMLVYVLGIQLASFPGPMSWLFQMFV